MKKYIDLEIEVINFVVEDVVRTSGDYEEGFGGFFGKTNTRSFDGSAGDFE